MSSCRCIGLVLDCRGANKLVFAKALSTAVVQLAELINVCLVADDAVGDGQPGISLVQLRVVVVSQSGAIEVVVEALNLDRSDVNAASTQLARVVERLRAHVQGEAPVPTATEVVPLGQGRVRSLVEATHLILAGSCDCMPPPLILLVTASVGYADLFASLFGLSSIALHAHLHALVVEMEVVCTTRTSMGAVGVLSRCSYGCDEVRAAVQNALAPVLLPNQGVREVVLQLSPTVATRCVAERPYLADLTRAATMDSFPSSQMEVPSLILCGGSLRHSRFELARSCHGGPPPTLHLLRLLQPEMVEENTLHDNSWIIRAHDDWPAQGSAFAAIFAAFHADVLLLATEAEEPKEPTPPTSTAAAAVVSAPLQARHQLVLPRQCFIAYFLDHTALLLRQVIPTELRRLRVLCPQPSSTRSACAEDSAMREALQNLREELIHNDQPGSSKSMDELCEGGINRLAADLRPETRWRLQLTRS